MVGKSRLSYDHKESRNVIEYEGHIDRLGFVYLGNPSHELPYFTRKRADTSKECMAYDGYCKQKSVGLVELRKTKSDIFACCPWSSSSCLYFLHLLCGPLPRTIKDQCHIHDLTLFDSFFDNDLEDDEFYCDICEEERDPRVCVYCCVECNFVTHVHCVISKVREVLTDQSERDVQLKVANEPTMSEANCDLVDEMQGKSPWSQKAGEYVYLVELFHPEKLKMKIGSIEEESSRKDNKKRVRKTRYSLAEKGEYIIPLSSDRIYRLLIEEQSYWSVECSNYDYKDNQLIEHDLLIPYMINWRIDDDDRWNWSDFKGIMYRIKDSYKRDKSLRVKYSNSWVKMVKVGNHMVPWILAPIQLMLFNHFNDLHPSNLTEEMVSLGYTILCTLIHSMNRTRVRDLNEDILRDWCCQAMCLKSLAFKIDFVFQRLKQVSYAYFKRRLQVEAPKMLAKEIGEAKQKIVFLEKEIVETKLKIAKHEAELERVKKISWEPSSAKSNFLNMCLKEASVLERKFVGKDLIK